VVGIVVVSHSGDLARGLVELAGQMAGGAVAIEDAGGGPDGGLGTSADLVSDAITRADGGDGVVVLGDLGSAFLTARHVLEERQTDGVRLVDAPLVEGAIAAAVSASAGLTLAEVAKAAEETRSALKL
jgi:phosphoenolpyruvate---glycerone phosphotransferase subunit DhaM